jgi:parallel beta-helix repeat protein
MIHHRCGIAASCGARSLLLMLAMTASPSQAEPVPIDMCATVLSAAGEYELVQDIGPCPGDGIVIASSGVQLNLGGHTIHGPPAPQNCDFDQPQVGVLVHPGLSDVTIRGGTISGFLDGIDLYASDSYVSGMHLTDNCAFGIVVSGERNQLSTSVIQNGFDGVGLCAAQEATLLANDIFNNARFAISLSCHPGANQNTIERNILRCNGLSSGEGGGIAIFNGSGNRVENNAIVGNRDGISLTSGTGSVVVGNTVHGNMHSGITESALSQNNFVSGNSEVGNEGAAALQLNLMCGNSEDPGHPSN